MKICLPSEGVNENKTESSNSVFPSRMAKENSLNAFTTSVNACTLVPTVLLKCVYDVCSLVPTVFLRFSFSYYIENETGKFIFDFP